MNWVRNWDEVDGFELVKCFQDLNMMLIRGIAFDVDLIRVIRGLNSVEIGS